MIFLIGQGIEVEAPIQVPGLNLQKSLTLYLKGWNGPRPGFLQSINARPGLREILVERLAGERFRAQRIRQRLVEAQGVLALRHAQAMTTEQLVDHGGQHRDDQQHADERHARLAAGPGNHAGERG